MKSNLEMEIEVLDIKGGKTGRTVALSEGVFGVQPNDHAIYLDVKQYLANQRQGTHKAKERAEIAGSTRKIKRQKGTGTARAGSIKSPVFRGGGRVFGPRPRSYSFKLNKKLKGLARVSALSYKATEAKIIVLEDFSFEAPKTKQYLDVLGSLADVTAEKTRTLHVLAENDKNVYKSSTNINKAKVITVNELNTYDILNADVLILSEKSAEKLSNS